MSYLSMFEEPTQESLDAIQQEALERYELDYKRLEIMQDIPYDRLRELADAEREGRFVVMPCKVGDTVFVDKRATPYRYFHPHDRVGAFAKCTVIGASITKSGIKIKMRANYPSRCGQYGFLKMGAGAFGKTVFFTQPEAERAIAATEPKGDAT